MLTTSLNTMLPPLIVSLPAPPRIVTKEALFSIESLPFRALMVTLSIILKYVSSPSLKILGFIFIPSMFTTDNLNAFSKVTLYSPTVTITSSFEFVIEYVPLPPAICSVEVSLKP